MRHWPFTGRYTPYRHTVSAYGRHRRVHMAALRLQGCWPGTLSGPARQARDWQVWALPAPLRGFVLAVTAAAVTATGVATAATRWRLPQLAVFVALLACGVALIESTRTIREVHG